MCLLLGGYKNGQTSVNTIHSRFLEKSRAVVTTDSEAHFKAKDYFLGLANSWRINSLPWINSLRWIKDGRLGFNVAVARLKGDYSSDSKTRTQTFQTEATDTKTQFEEGFTAPTIGWRLGLNWSYPISNEFAYTISLEYYNYHMEKIREEGVEFTVDEDLFGVKVSFIYTFDPRKLW
jgi:hypothetical protein